MTTQHDFHNNHGAAEKFATRAAFTYRLGRVLLWAVFILVLGCGLEEEQGENTSGPLITLDGAGQKGPFAAGSRVTAKRLAGGVASRAVAAEAFTVNNLGDFKLALAEPGVYEIAVEGYYFNEITGTLSNQEKTLTAVAVLQQPGAFQLNINVLTHMATPRIEYLLQQGVKPADAVNIAETEILDAFRGILAVEDGVPFTQMDVYRKDESPPVSGAYLLALTALIYQYANTAAAFEGRSMDGKLFEVLTGIAADLETDGDVDDGEMMAALDRNSRWIDPDNIAHNLRRRALQTGREIEPVEINRVLDNDSDGVVNAEDDDDDGDGLADDQDPRPYFNKYLNDRQAIIFPGSGPLSEITDIKLDFPIGALYPGEVQYFVDDQPVATVYNPPYGFQWNPYLWSYQESVALSASYRNRLGDRELIGPLQIPLASDLSHTLVLKPADGMTLATDELPALSVLSGHHRDNASFYRFEIMNEATPFAPVIQRFAGQTVTLPALPAGAYRWRVSATAHETGLQWPAWSTWRTLTVENGATPADAERNPALVAAAQGWTVVPAGQTVQFSMARSYKQGDPWIDPDAPVLSGYRWWVTPGDLAGESDSPGITIDLPPQVTGAVTVSYQVSDGNGWSPVSQSGLLVVDAGRFEEGVTDLVLNTLSVKAPFPAEVAPLVDLTVSVTVTNQGTVDLMDVGLQCFISSTRRFDPATDREILNTLLPPMTAGEKTGMVALGVINDHDIPDDDYYTYCIVDPENAIQETGEQGTGPGNNLAVGNVLRVYSAPVVIF